MIFHLLPDLAVSIGIPADDHGGLLAYWRGVVIVTYLLMHYSAFWHYRLTASVFSQCLGVIGLVCIAQAPSVLLLFIGLTFHGQLVGFNYFAGLFYSTAGSSQESRSLAAGLHEASLAAGMAAGTVLGGTLGTLVNERAPWFLAAGVLSGLIALQLTAWKRWHGSLRAEPAAIAR